MNLSDIQVKGETLSHFISRMVPDRKGKWDEYVMAKKAMERKYGEFLSACEFEEACKLIAKRLRL